MRDLAKKALMRLSRPELVREEAFINGEWRRGLAAQIVVDPANGQTIAEVAVCGAETIDEAVGAADAAFSGWRRRTPLERGQLLSAWAAAMRRNASDLAVILTAEQGKPLPEAHREIVYGASFLDWFAAEGQRGQGEMPPSHLPGNQLSVRMQPVGVTAAITPWNFPCAMITRKASAALAAGCPMIVKPAPETPLSALALAVLAQEAGIPAGVFQILTGDAAPLADRLLSHAKVRALSFTGSTEVGRHLLGLCARTVKRTSMELGGHAPFIVFDDAVLDAAVHGCVEAKFATSGQDCLAANRIYVQRAIYKDFVAKFFAAMARLKVGHGLRYGVDIGPMTKASVAAKCETHVADAQARGARVMRAAQSQDFGGNFVSPTVLVDVTDEMSITIEETFGPIAAILPFDDEEEVLTRANLSEAGLAAYVYTSGLGRALRMADRLEYGMVALNTTKMTGAPIPFGGWKQSGLGREGSRHGLLEFQETKYICTGGL